MQNNSFELFLKTLTKRHLATLQFAEMRRAVQALSEWYVQKRADFTPQKILDGKGKRAAFACYYAPLHYLLIEQIAKALEIKSFTQLIELGCGTGLAGCALTIATESQAEITGYDIHPWAVAEAQQTYAALNLRGKAFVKDINAVSFKSHGAILAAFSVNELSDEQRFLLLNKLLQLKNAQILIVEPIGKKALPWWQEWEDAFVQHQGKSNTWRFNVKLPEFLQKMDKAAGLKHHELTGKSLFLTRFL